MKSVSSEEEAPSADEFWKAWHSHKEYLIRLSMIWMNISAADAEDAFSDATIRAYEKYADHAAQISNERAWFARLLHNICIDKHRANKRLKNLYEKVKEISTIDLSAYETRQLTPEGNLLNSELGLRLREAIEGLPDRLRGPVVLRLVQGEEYETIAHKLGISNDNVRKRVQQGRALLRENLEIFRG
ncbi:sigma-70 family RNA polymerase sigma factor [uncultured Sneathiella sp.]|uniref:RNA polymerase sigma factor n=1 Tax=uncultured Sneathiella sp. TaxID=879315 RepID=UPI0030EC9CC6